MTSRRRYQAALPLRSVLFAAQELCSPEQAVIRQEVPGGGEESCVKVRVNERLDEQRIGVNPGLEAAHRAAALIGCGVAWPQGIEGTDWCDALTTWGGPVASRKIERLILTQARYVTRENNMT